MSLLVVTIGVDHNVLSSKLDVFLAELRPKPSSCMAQGIAFSAAANAMLAGPPNQRPSSFKDANAQTCAHEKTRFGRAFLYK